MNNSFRNKLFVEYFRRDLLLQLGNYIFPRKFNK